MNDIEREPRYSADQRAIAAALDEAGAPRKVGTLSLNLVERVAVLDRDFRRAVEALERIAGVYERTMPGPRDAQRERVLELIAAYRAAGGQ